jgi:hypothetical protein
MATDKKFAVAGVSTHEGKTKIRFMNDSLRVKILKKHGHTDIDLIDLPNEMTKAEIAAHMIATGFGAGNPAIQDAIADLAKKNKVATAVTATEPAATAADTATAAAEPEAALV